MKHLRRLRRPLLPFDSARPRRASLGVLAGLALLLIAGRAGATATLTVSQVVSPSPRAGSPVTYLLVVTNTGPVITDLTVADTVSPVLTGLLFDQPAPAFAAPVVANVAPSGTLVAWSASGLAMATGESFTFTITGTVGLVCPPVTIMATAWAAGTDGVAPGEASETDAFPLGFLPAMAVSQSPGSPAPGALVTYTLAFANQGEVTVESVMIVDTVGPELLNPQPNCPPGFTVTATASGQNVIFTWTGSAVAPVNINIDFTVTGTAAPACLPVTFTNTGYLLARSHCATVEFAALTAWSFDPGTISPPTGLAAYRGDGWAVVGWDAGFESTEFINRYHVWRSQNGGLTTAFAGTVWVDTAVSPNNTDTRMFWDRGLANGVTYTYLVQAITGCVTVFSGPVSVTPTAYLGSAVPFGTVYTAPGDGYIKLFWPHPAVVWDSPGVLETRVSIYKIFRATTAGGPVWTPLINVTNAGNKIDTGLANLQPYFYMVVPCCPDRIPSFTFATAFRPASGQGMPGARTDASGPRAVRVFWDPGLPGDYGISGYHVFRSDDGGKTANLVSGPTPITQLFFLDNVPAYGKQYVYIIRPVDSQGNNGIAYPAVLIFVAIPVNRLYLNHNQFRPARNESLSVIFQITEPGRTRVSVYTQTGERIRTLFDQEEQGNFTPDTPFNARDRGLPPLIWDGTNDRGELVSSGAYLLVLEINKSRDVRTVVVIR